VYADEDYSKIISALQSLAALYLRKSMYNQAETSLLKLLEIQQQVHGASHPDTLATTFRFVRICRLVSVLYIVRKYYRYAECCYVALHDYL
jgi:hypothetical protein